MRRTITGSAVAVVLAFVSARAYSPPPQQPLTVPTIEPVPITTAADIEGSPLFTAENVKTMMQMLDRIDRILSAARADVDSTKPANTKRPSELKVSIDVTSIDEIRAEVAQLKMLVQPPSKPSSPH